MTTGRERPRGRDSRNRPILRWGVRVTDAQDRGELVTFFSSDSREERDAYVSGWRDALRFLAPTGRDLTFTRLVKKGPLPNRPDRDGNVVPERKGDPWRCGACGLEGVMGSGEWHGPGSEFCPLSKLEVKEGDPIFVTDFEGVTHEATLMRVVPIFHECDDDPCKHRMWAAEWLIGPPGSDGRRVWPIGKDWDRVRSRLSEDASSSARS